MNKPRNGNVACSDFYIRVGGETRWRIRTTVLCLIFSLITMFASRKRFKSGHKALAKVSTHLASRPFCDGVLLRRIFIRLQKNIFVGHARFACSTDVVIRKKCLISDFVSFVEKVKNDGLCYGAMLITSSSFCLLLLAQAVKYRNKSYSTS